MSKETNSLKILSDEDCTNAWKACFENAQRHQVSASLVAGPERYGTAITLLVLGTEEYVKGFLYWLQSNHINIRNVKGIQLFFTDHVIRHTLAFMISMCFDLCREFMGMVYKLRDQLHEQREPAWTAFQAAAMSKDDNKMESLMMPMMTLMDWWQEANDKKNGGLYVGTTSKPGELQTPDAITKEQYEYGVQVVNEFGKRLQVIIDYIEGLNEEHKILFASTANNDGMLEVIAKVTEGFMAQRKKKTSIIESLIADMKKINRADS